MLCRDNTHQEANKSVHISTHFAESHILCNAIRGRRGSGPAGDACPSAAARCWCSADWEAQGCRGEDQREKLKHGVWTSRTPWLEEINNPICDLPSGTGSGGIKLPGAQIFTSTLLSKNSREGCGTDLWASGCSQGHAYRRNWLLQQFLSGFHSPKEKRDSGYVLKYK